MNYAPMPSAGPIGAALAGGPAALPPSPRRVVAAMARQARISQRSAPSSPRARSPSPRRAGAGRTDVASPTGADAEPVGLSNADVLDKVKRSFASVRAGLTEQRAQSGELSRQMAVGMAKIDQLTVAHEGLVAARVAEQASMATLMQRLDEIKAMLAADEGGNDEADADDENEDSDTWVNDVKVRSSLRTVFLGGGRACV